MPKTPECDWEAARILERELQWFSDQLVRQESKAVLRRIKNLVHTKRRTQGLKAFTAMHELFGLNHNVTNYAIVLWLEYLERKIMAIFDIGDCPSDSRKERVIPALPFPTEQPPPMHQRIAPQNLDQLSPTSFLCRKKENGLH